MKTFAFENNYGKAELTAMSDEIQVKDVFFANTPNECKYPLDTIEKFTLISENRKVQVYSDWKGNQASIIYHPTGSTAIICKITLLEMEDDNMNAQDEIERVNSARYSAMETVA